MERLGRPPKYNTPEEMQEKIKDYIQNCPDTKTVYFKLKDDVVEKEVPCPTITGLALHLGFCNRASMYDYEKKEDFTHTIKKARAFIEKEYEMQLQSGNPTGAIFALKNFGWIDESHLKGEGFTSVINVLNYHKELNAENDTSTRKRIQAS